MMIDPLDTLRTRRSAKWTAYPDDVLPLFVAEMDTPLAPPVREALRAAVDNADTGYSSHGAGAAIGEAFAGFAARRWGWEPDPARFHSVPDISVGVVETLRLLARPGDAVVISPPVYPPYFEWPREAGAQLREVPLGADHRLDLAALERAFADHPVAYLLCNPHNPVGRVHTRAELTALVTLASRYGVTIISDEIFAGLVLPGTTYTPFLDIPGASAVGLSIVSASKTFNLAGLKCAAVVEGDRDLTYPPEVRWRAGHLGVLATIAAFTAGGEWLEELLAFLDARRSQLGDLLGGIPGLSWTPPEATYLGWVDCRALNLPAQPADFFLEHGKVALEPGLRFGALGADHFRINFATSPDILSAALERISAAVLHAPAHS